MQGGDGGGGGGLYDGDSHVLSLTSTSFPAKSDQSVYLIEFYAPWYGLHISALLTLCITLLPKR